MNDCLRGWRSLLLAAMLAALTGGAAAQPLDAAPRPHLPHLPDAPAPSAAREPSAPRVQHTLPGTARPAAPALERRLPEGAGAAPAAEVPRLRPPSVHVDPGAASLAEPPTGRQRSSGRKRPVEELEFQRTELTGQPYRTLTMPASPGAPDRRLMSCRIACSEDEACRAWTYRAPATRQGAGQCTLKQTAGRRRPEAFSTSGRWGVPGFDRPGGDYRPPLVSTPAHPMNDFACFAACLHDAPCMSWTLRHGSPAQCHLKDKVMPAVPDDDDATSGSMRVE